MPAGPSRRRGRDLVAVLRERQRVGAGPLTLLSSDNLRHNGDRSREGLLQFIGAVGDAGLLAWVTAHTSGPSSMVDSTMPRPTPDVAGRVKAATGCADAAPVMAERFIQ